MPQIPPSSDTIVQADLDQVVRVIEVAKNLFPHWAKTRGIRKPEEYDFDGVTATAVVFARHRGYDDYDRESIPFADLLNPEAVIAKAQQAEADLATYLRVREAIARGEIQDPASSD